MIKKVIICVDDEKGILDGLVQQLSRNFSENFLLEFAQSGSEAIELIEELMFENFQISLLITDQMMPGMSGSELISVVQEISPNTKCILLTGYIQSEIIKDLPQQNLLGCMPKPWERDSLIELIRSANMN
jgi:adenylate cyclase